MTLAETILAQVNGAYEARNEAMMQGGSFAGVNGIEVITFWQDNSTLIIIGGCAVFAGKGM